MPTAEHVIVNMVGFVLTLMIFISYGRKRLQVNKLYKILHMCVHIHIQMIKEINMVL